jgi:hypothetical protein
MSLQYESAIREIARAAGPAALATPDSIDPSHLCMLAFPDVPQSGNGGWLCIASRGLRVHRTVNRPLRILAAIRDASDTGAVESVRVKPLGGVALHFARRG